MAQVTRKRSLTELFFIPNSWAFRLGVLSLGLNETLGLVALNSWVYRALIKDFGAIEEAMLPGTQLQSDFPAPS